MSKRQTKKTLKSKRPRRKPHTKLGHGQTNKNAKNLRRVFKAQDEEDEFDVPVVRSESIEDIEKRQGHGFWGNPTTGYIYNKDMQ